MIRFFIFLIINCAFTVKVNAQFMYNKLYDYDGSNTYKNSVSTALELNNGDFVLGGNKYLPIFGALHFIKIKSDGDTIFTKKYPINGSSYEASMGNSLINSFDGNYIQSGIFINSNNDRNALLIKLNQNLDTLWTKTYGGNNFDNANCVVQTPDSGFVMMGVTQSYSNGPASDFYMIKTDKNGNFLWQKVYGTTLAEDCVSGQITLDGGFIMAGHRNYMLHIVKTDSVGNFKWEKTYGANNVAFIKQLKDSTYILVGAKNVSGLALQAYIAKLDKAGNIIWDKTYGGLEDQILYTVPVILNDGSIVCAGSSQHSAKPWGLLIKTDSMGNQLWSREFYANPIGSNYVYCLKHTSDNGFLMVGSGNITGQDAWIVKVDSNGCLIANCNVGVYENEEEFSILKVYPNPSTEQCNIEIQLPQNENAELIIYDVLGKEIKRYTIKNNETLNINTSEYNNGIYFITLTNEKGLIEKQRLIINK